MYIKCTEEFIIREDGKEMIFSPFRPPQEFPPLPEEWDWWKASERVVEFQLPAWSLTFQRQAYQVAVERREHVLGLRISRQPENLLLLTDGEVIFYSPRYSEGARLKWSDSLALYLSLHVAVIATAVEGGWCHLPTSTAGIKDYLFSHLPHSIEEVREKVYYFLFAACQQAAREISILVPPPPSLTEEERVRKIRQRVEDTLRKKCWEVLRVASQLELKL